MSVASGGIAKDKGSPIILSNPLQIIVPAIAVIHNGAILVLTIVRCLEQASFDSFDTHQPEFRSDPSFPVVGSSIRYGSLSCHNYPGSCVANLQYAPSHALRLHRRCRRGVLRI